MLMKKNFLSVFLFSLIALVITCFSSIILVELDLKLIALAISIGLIVLSFILLLTLKKHKGIWLLNFFINSIATGFSISAYYSIKNIQVNYFEGSIVTLFLALFLFVIYLLFKKDINLETDTFKIIVVGVILILCTLAIFWVKFPGTIFYSFSFFLLLNSLFYIFSYHNLVFEKEQNALKTVTIFSYGVYFLITLFVIALLTDGDADLSGLDIPYISKNDRKK
jgi:hypothetical protein